MPTITEKLLEKFEKNKDGSEEKSIKDVIQENVSAIAIKDSHTKDDGFFSYIFSYLFGSSEREILNMAVVENLNIRTTQDGRLIILEGIVIDALVYIKNINGLISRIFYKKPACTEDYGIKDNKTGEKGEYCKLVDPDKKIIPLYKSNQKNLKEIESFI